MERNRHITAAAGMELTEAMSAEGTARAETVACALGDPTYYAFHDPPEDT